MSSSVLIALYEDKKPFILLTVVEIIVCRVCSIFSKTIINSCLN